jgi:acetyl esterase/lipase
MDDHEDLADIAALRVHMAHMVETDPRGPAVRAVYDLVVPTVGIGSRLYIPTECDQGNPGMPAIVWFHGGGFVAGDVNNADGPCRAMAEKSRAAVLSIDYRLAPEFPAPTPGEDAINSLKFVLERGGEWGLDVNRIAVGGASAGGGLAALAAQTMKSAPGLVAQALVYPLLDCSLSAVSIDANDDAALSRGTLTRWMDLYLDGMKGDDPSLSALWAPAEGLPPCVITYGLSDPLLGDSEAYQAKLQAAGIEVRAWPVGGIGHGFFKNDAIGGPAIERVSAALSCWLGTQR